MQSLSEPGLRGCMPCGCDLQARRGRDRPCESGQVPRMEDVYIRVSLQEGVFQLGNGEVGEMHPLLSEAGNRPGTRMLPFMCGAYPVSRRTFIRRRPYQCNCGIAGQGACGRTEEPDTRPL